MVSLFQYLVAVTTFHVAVVAVIETANIGHTHLASLYPFLEDTELFPGSLRRVLVHLANDFAGFRQNKTGLEVGDGLSQWSDPGFLRIDDQTSFSAHPDQFIPAILQISHILVDKVSIIHIPSITFDPQHFLDVVVYWVL